MITYHSERLMTYLKITLFIALGMIFSSNMVSMENPNSSYMQINSIENGNTGLTQVRNILTNKQGSKEAIIGALVAQKHIFDRTYDIVKDLKPLTSLTPKCYLTFIDNAKTKGATYDIQQLNADKTGFTCPQEVTFTDIKNKKFKINSKKTKNLIVMDTGVSTPGQGQLDKPLHIIMNPGSGNNNKDYYFIFEKPDNTQPYLDFLKFISEIGNSIQDGKYKNEDIENRADKLGIPQALIDFAQVVLKQVQLLKQLYVYDTELAKNNHLLALTQKLPQDILSKDQNLILLQKITAQFKSIYEVLQNAQKNGTQLQPTLLKNMQELLEQWTTIFDNYGSLDQFAQQIIHECDLWLPTIKWAPRIENKHAHDNNNNSPSILDNKYADGSISNSPFRYDPPFWLNQCKKTIGGITGQLYNNRTIPVINNLYINSPLMIDHFLLKYGIKTIIDEDNISYALKGTIYILFPVKDQWGNIVNWNHALNNNTNQKFCIEKTFHCSAKKNIINGTYEVFHRGHTCSSEIVNNAVHAGYANDTCMHDNWFLSNNQNPFDVQLNPINVQQTQSDTLNGYTINKYCTGKSNCTYSDCFNNQVKVTDSSVHIFMPTLERCWAMEIVLEKPKIHQTL
jgi:hypothetical protein